MPICLPSFIGVAQPAGGGAFNNYSISLDGTNQTSLDVASTSDFAFGTSGFSIGFWFKPDGTNNSSGFGVNIFDMRTNSPNQAKPTLWMSSVGSGSILKYYAAGVFTTTWSGTLNSGSWYHLLITNDGSDTKFYLNGNSNAIATGSDTTSYISAALRVGGYSGNGYYYQGLTDEFAIWDATLSGADSTAIYNSGNPNDLDLAASYDTDRTSNLIGWWRMGDGSDGSGNADGTLVNIGGTDFPQIYNVATDGSGNRITGIDGSLTNIASPNGIVSDVPS